MEKELVYITTSFGNGWGLLYLGYDNLNLVIELYRKQCNQPLWWNY